VGGAEADVERVRPVLGAYGDPVLYVGPLGAGQGVKLVNNALFAANIGLLADAVRLGERLGVDEAVLLTALPHGSAASRALAALPRTGGLSSRSPKPSASASPRTSLWSRAPRPAWGRTCRPARRSRRRR
jgi:3-hydroxyisobutyrate dehydrogenase-like beta-hydroxyacid dehydrogenase